MPVGPHGISRVDVLTTLTIQAPRWSSWYGIGSHVLTRRPLGYGRACILQHSSFPFSCLSLRGFDRPSLPCSTTLKWVYFFCRYAAFGCHMCVQIGTIVTSSLTSLLEIVLMSYSFIGWNNMFHFQRPRVGCGSPTRGSLYRFS